MEIECSYRDDIRVDSMALVFYQPTWENEFVGKNRRKLMTALLRSYLGKFIRKIVPFNLVISFYSILHKTHGCGFLCRSIFCRNYSLHLLSICENAGGNPAVFSNRHSPQPMFVSWEYSLSVFSPTCVHEMEILFDSFIQKQTKTICEFHMQMHTYAMKNRPC